jgi:competence protein ComEC
MAKRHRRLVVWLLALWAATLLGKNASFAATSQRGLVLCIAALAIVGLRTRLFAVTCIFFAVGIVNGASSWWAVDSPLTGNCEGVATFVDDPEVRARATYAIVKIDNVRYKAVAYGAVARRLSQRLMGEQVHIVGECSANSGRFIDWDRQRHILGRINVSQVHEEHSSGSAMYRSANRIRRHIMSSVEPMDPGDRALFAGLVMGDDRDQPRSMILSFRASGLSHLCAVSGQNVAYVLAAAGVFLRARRTVMRVILTCALLSWFVVLTRAEPSVVRAGVMAGIVAIAFAFGRETNTKEVLCTTGLLLLCVDPMMARSVGFMLSTAATAGLAWMSPWTARIVGDGPIRRVISAPMAAHLGTAPVSLFYFHNLPVIALLANPFAVPLAGFVMLVGLPVSIFVSLLPDVLGLPIVYGLEIPVRLLWWIAVVSDVISPRGAPNALCWLIVAGTCLWRYQRVSRGVDVAG